MTATQCAAATAQDRAPGVAAQHLPSRPHRSLRLLCGLRTARPAACCRWTVGMRASRAAVQVTKPPNFPLQPAALPAAREPGHAGHAATTASTRRRTHFSTSSCATTHISMMRHAIAHGRILTPTLVNSGNREAGSIATPVAHARPHPQGQSVLRVRPCVVVTALIVLLKAVHCRPQVMTRPFLSSRRSLAAEAVDARALGCASSPPGRCWTSWQSASTIDSSLPVSLSQSPPPRC